LLFQNLKERERERERERKKERDRERKKYLCELDLKLGKVDTKLTLKVDNQAGFSKR
jgi:hypothetical protein